MEEAKPPVDLILEESMRALAKRCLDRIKTKILNPDHPLLVGSFKNREYQLDVQIVATFTVQYSLFNLNDGNTCITTYVIEPKPDHVEVQRVYNFSSDAEKRSFQIQSEEQFLALIEDFELMDHHSEDNKD
jgi:hypothetical protein